MNFRTHLTKVSWIFLILYCTLAITVDIKIENTEVRYNKFADVELLENSFQFKYDINF